MFAPSAHTTPINPAATPANEILTAAEVWKGLIEKCRRPQDYLPFVAGCEIESESEDGLLRIVEFKADAGETGKFGKVREEIKWLGNTIVEFLAREPEHDWRILNILSNGAGGPEDLYLTFTFEWNKDTMQPGTAEEAGVYYKQMQAGLEHTIAVIRQTKAKGEL